MTTISQKNIVPGVLLAGVAASLHTAPALTRERIINATATNDTTGAIALTVWIGAAAGSAQKKISARTIAPGETYCCPELINRTLEPGDSITALGVGLAIDISAFTQV